MANGNKKVRKSNKQTRRARARRSKRSRPTVTSSKSTSRSSGLGTVLHKGVRSMLTLLPGSAITTKVADAVFAALGWSDNAAFTAATSEFAGDVWFNGLYTCFYITPAMLLGDAICALTVDVPNNANAELRNVQTNYATSRLVNFTVVCRNSGPNTTHGSWGIGFWPFKTSSDISNVDYIVSNAALADIRQAPLYVTGPSSQPLVLKHRFGLSDWFARTPAKHTNKLGLVAVSYMDDIRGSYGEFTCADFDPMIEVSGSVLLASKRADQVTTFQNAISLPGTPAAVIRTKSGRYNILSGTMKCTKKAGEDYCSVQGTARRVTHEVTLEDMALE